MRRFVLTVTAIAAGMLLAALYSACEQLAKEPVVRPNVLLILIDALRKDHLSLYGYFRKASPNIDKLAKTGWVFDNHIAHAGQTVPSTISLMLSQYPV